MSINVEHLQRCITTLENALKKLEDSKPGSVDYDIFRNATIKGYELSLETAGKLLKKGLKPFFASPKEVDRLRFKELFRHANKHSTITTEECERWFAYHDNRNTTAHDYGAGFAESTLKLIPDFIVDAKKLAQTLSHP